MNYQISPVIRGFTEISHLYNQLSKIKGWFICGGYVRYMVSKKQEPVKAGDVDIFTSTESDVAAINTLLSEKLDMVHESDISFSYKVGEKTPIEWLGTPRVQLIKPKNEGRLQTAGTLQEVLDNFDYTVVRCGLISPTQAMIDHEFHEHDIHNKIIIRNIHCPVGSIFRVIKYCAKGYRIKPLELIKIFLDWEQRGPDYRVKLTELLTKAATFDEDLDTSGLTKEETELLYKIMSID